MKYAFIQKELSGYSVKRACAVLQVSTSGYYKALHRSASVAARRRAELAQRIKILHAANRQLYGSPRIHRALLAQGQKVCENTVARVMREHCIRAKTRRRFVPRTTDSTHDQPLAKNLLQRRFAAEALNRKWATDITYIPTDEGWLYLAGVMDLCSRRIVGWSMADHMETELVTRALHMALEQRRPAAGLLHHSDRGVQYASEDYRHLLQQQGMQASMSGKGDCWDNACCESFWATLKTELVHHHKYATREQARLSIFEYIEVFYNRQRLHSAIGYMSPEAFEASLN